MPAFPRAAAGSAAQPPLLFLSLTRHASFRPPDPQLAGFLAKTEAYLTNLGTKIATTRLQGETEQAAAEAAKEAEARGLSPEEAAAAAAAAAATVREAKQEELALSAANASGTNAGFFKLAHTVDEKVMKQPAMLKFGSLRHYQKIGLQWMISLYNNHLNGILADEMGLGKTVQVMALIAYLWEHKGNRGPHLLVVPNAVTVNWKSELNLWLPDVHCVYYTGTSAEREAVYKREILPMRFNVLVTTFELAMRQKKQLSKIPWRYLIVDEAQRLKDRNSLLSRTLAELDRKNCLFLTGTPLQNDVAELWALLNLLLPDVFTEKELFETWFKPKKDGGAGDVDEWLETEKKALVIARLHQARLGCAVAWETENPRALL